MTLKPILALAAATFLVACAQEGTYPGSGDVCTADDPVQTLDMNDCTVPVGSPTSF